MKKLTLLMVLATLIFAIGCGGKKDDGKLDIYDLDKIVEKGEQMSKDMDNAQAKLEARKKKGDTIAIAWETLNSVIPDIAGYTRSEPQGMKMSFDNTSYSNATATFTKDNSNIEVSLFDYNVVVSLFAGVTAWRTLGLSVESNEGYQKVTKFDEIKDSWMFEEYNKSGKRATVTVSLNDRYWMQVSASEQPNTDFAKQLAMNVARNGKDLFNK